MQHDLTVDTLPLRIVGASAVAAAVALPFLPGHEEISCPLRATTGVPCPFCGMTRGVGRAVRGDVGGALALNPGAVLLVLGALGLLVAFRRRNVRMPLWAPVALVTALWTYQILKLVTGRPL